MRIHYFQRYHQKENVATANTMLLLSRLYSYSPDKFFRFLKNEYFMNSFDPEIVFSLQEKSIDSIPDATISQEGFKIVVETKMTDWFYSSQLINHLKAFGEEKNKLLITLASEPMDKEKLEAFEKQLKEYNKNQKYPVLHINTTFEIMAQGIYEVIDDRDYEMQDVLEDYINYCYNDGLIVSDDAWKYLRMQLAGTTIDYNIAKNLYYDNAERGFRPHKYLGLYTRKSIRAIGEISAIITASVTGDGIEYKAELGELTEECKEMIVEAMDDGRLFGYDLKSTGHRYFFVEEFHETDFKKTSRGGSMGTRIFDLTQVLDREDIPEIGELAELLKDRTWE